MSKFRKNDMVYYMKDGKEMVGSVISVVQGCFISVLNHKAGLDMVDWKDAKRFSSKKQLEKELLEIADSYSFEELAEEHRKSTMARVAARAAARENA